MLITAVQRSDSIYKSMFMGVCCMFSCHVVSASLWPMDCSLPGSSVHGILQARILEWVAISSSRGSSWPRDQTCVSCIASGFFTAEPPGKPIYVYIYIIYIFFLIFFPLWFIHRILNLFFFIHTLTWWVGPNFFSFCWSIVELQCCVNYCYTAKWLSYTYIYVCIIYIYMFFFIFFSVMALSQDIEYSCLLYTVGPCFLSILYILVCIC